MTIHSVHSTIRPSWRAKRVKYSSVGVKPRTIAAMITPRHPMYGRSHHVDAVSATPASACGNRACRSPSPKSQYDASVRMYSAGP